MKHVYYIVLPIAAMTALLFTAACGSTTGTEHSQHTSQTQTETGQTENSQNTSQAQAATSGAEQSQDTPQVQAETHEAEHSEHGSTETGSHHHSDSLVISFMPSNQIKANQETSLSAVLTNENQPLTEAKVMFEYWLADEEKHEFIDASESNPGEYSASVTIPKSGDYTVNVHVEKGKEIHDHQEASFKVE